MPTSSSTISRLPGRGQHRSFPRLLLGATLALGLWPALVLPARAATPTEEGEPVPTTVSFDESCVTVYGRVLAELRQRGTGVGDALLAGAIAMNDDRAIVAFRLGDRAYFEERERLPELDTIMRHRPLGESLTVIALRHPESRAANACALFYTASVVDCNTWPVLRQAMPLFLATSRVEGRGTAATAVPWQAELERAWLAGFVGLLNRMGALTAIHDATAVAPAAAPGDGTAIPTGHDLQRLSEPAFAYPLLDAKRASLDDVLMCLSLVKEYAARYDAENRKGVKTFVGYQLAQFGLKAEAIPPTDASLQRLTRIYQQQVWAGVAATTPVVAPSAMRELK